MFFHFFIIIFGFLLLIYGADILVKGASGIAQKFNISEIIIGLTVVSLGTSLPELIITITSSSSNSQDLIIGNVIGSNICNLLLILGLLSIIKPIKFENSSLKTNIPILILLSALILVMAFIPLNSSTNNISFSEGIILLVISFIYLFTPLVKHLKKSKNLYNEKDLISNKSNNTSIFKNLSLILLGGFALKYGGDFVVDSSVKVADHFNIAENIIGLTIVALGTSLPELITSIVAIIKGNSNIAEGNIIGSCIINFCLILGVGAILSTISIDQRCIQNLILLIGSTTLIWLYALSDKNNILKRSNGIILLFIFTIYVIHLFVV